MIEVLVLSVAMVSLTVVVHFAGILALLYALRRHGRKLHVHESIAHQGIAVLFVMLSLLFIHGIEI